MSKQIKSVSVVDFPATEPSYNFSFTTVDSDGVFKFHFKWINAHWNCWVTTPNGDVRPCSVYANVVSWLGFLDYGIIFSTDLPTIGFNDLFSTELMILKWA